MKLTIRENLQENIEHLQEMAKLYKLDTNLPVNLWLDEVGQNRFGKHNFPRLKFQSDSADKLNYHNLIPISISNNPEILIDNPPFISSKILNPVKDFIIHNRDILEQHFNNNITTKQLYPKIRIPEYYSISNTLEIIPNDFKNLVSKEEIRQDFYSIINSFSRRNNGLLEDRMNQNELQQFLNVFFDNQSECINAILNYDKKGF